VAFGDVPTPFGTSLGPEPAFSGSLSVPCDALLVRRVFARDMDSVLEAKGAKKVVETCAAVEAGEDVLVVADWEMTGVAERVTAAAKAADANVSVALMDPREYDGSEPPATVAAAMKRVDVILLPVTRGITHSSATNEAMEQGARVVDMIRFHPDEFVTGGLFADYAETKPKCEKMAEIITEAEEAHVQTEAGTDAVFGLQGSVGNSHPGIVSEPGHLTGAVNIEANTVPATGTTTGTLVFDASVPHLGIGVLDEDIVMEVEEGRVTHVEGGAEADRISEIWEEIDHPAATNIAQLAVGMNPECKQFNGRLQNDHGVLGSVHVGIGTSANLGGDTKAPIHFDAMMDAPTVTFDDKAVVIDGELNETYLRG
jgi:leucyl aminopeptidase (aminopeptidase T)